MVYLQATLTGDEPPDVLQYASRHSDFPRQSTFDQFFDEAQFEAYRALGHHIALQVFGEAASAWSGNPLNANGHRLEVRAVFARLREQWFPPLDCTPAEWVPATQAALQVEQHFNAIGGLIEYRHRLYPELAGGVPPNPPTGVLGEFQAVSQTLQVMEMAWNAMKLTSSHAHPLNRGWMNTFRRWTASDAFHRFWPFLRAEYSRPFVRFCEEILNLQANLPSPIRETAAAPISANDLATLDEQFAYEWADEFERLGLPSAEFPQVGYLDSALAKKVQLAGGDPFAWKIEQTVGGVSVPCGLVCVTKTDRQKFIEGGPIPPTDGELILWLRGAYRSLGIGRTVAQEVLQVIDYECAFQAALLERLVVYHPVRGGSSGRRLELERWMDFFFDLGFRRVRQPARPGTSFIILERDV
jgi:hypothetical protein